MSNQRDAGAGAWLAGLSRRAAAGTNRWHWCQVDDRGGSAAPLIGGSATKFAL